MKIFKNAITLFSVVTMILGQLIGFMAFNDIYAQRFKDLVIYTDISIILLLLFLFITKVMKKKNKIIYFIFIPLIAGFAIFSMWSYSNNPLNIEPFPTIHISTPDAKNPGIKLVTFETYVVNKSKKTVEAKFYFTKEDGTENWYPYYDIIPDLHVTEVYHLEPEKVEHISSEVIVKTDDHRLITSHFTDADVKYEVIK